MALEVETNFEAKVRAMADHPVRFTIVSIVENHTIKAIALHLERSVASAGKDNHFKAVCKSGYI